MSAQFDPEAEARGIACCACDDDREAVAFLVRRAFDAGAEQMRERAAVAVETRPIGTPTTVLEEAAAGFLRSLAPSVAGYIRTLPTRTDSPGEAK